MVKIWICYEYDTVFNFSCIASYKLTKSFTFYFISFLSQESDFESSKQSTCTLHASEILLSKVFMNACKLTGAMQIDICIEFTVTLHLHLTFSELIVSICNRLKFIWIINTVNLSLTNIWLYTVNKIVVLIQH